jgi:DNA-binding transcriptional ArsR family regulator
MKQARPKLGNEIERIDRVIHEPSRLGILSILASKNVLSFNEMKAYLGLTDGNLSTHLRVLEESGYVTIRKRFVGRKSHTSARLTVRGRRSFRNYLLRLERVVKGGKPD